MQNLPHRYSVVATTDSGGGVRLDSRRLASLHSSAPAEFGGPGDRWSPETLLTAAVADCFSLTFRAVATASRIAWTDLQVEADGTLDRIDRTMQFTQFDLRAQLRVPPGTNVEQARRALETAERGCLISNSLKATVHLEMDVQVGGPPIARPADEYASIA
jgi:organic hydroperoxide reductase OsmC/OhrA